MVLMTNAVMAVGVRPVIEQRTPTEPVSCVSLVPNRSLSVHDYYDDVPAYVADGRARAHARQGKLPDVKWDFWE
jgi:hypothetical protein